MRIKMAEREGFEPSMELLTPYSLSRGAPSASRPSLHIASNYKTGKYSIEKLKVKLIRGCAYKRGGYYIKKDTFVVIR